MALQATERARPTDEGADEAEDIDSIVVEFDLKWKRLCHACGTKKWFRGLICAECRDRYGV